MRIAFLGTPEFAVPSLKALWEAGHTLAVFTQPDRPAGRHNRPAPPPAKEFAQQHDIPVFQPARIKSEEGVMALHRFAPDLMVTAAFGQLLSKENLDIPPLGCINVHASLLPKYRGAAPIQWAIIQGETTTGITTMFTDIGMDTGDILLSDTIAIEPNETAGELARRLAALGAKTLMRTLSALESGELRRIPQNDAQASYCPMLKKEHGRLDFSQSALAVHNRVRGTNPWPGAYALLGDAPLKFWQTRPLDETPPGPPGLCFGSDKSGLFIACNGGAIEVLALQLPGGKRLDGKSFLRGKPILGQVLT
jgi:methionyl-tRNA formyltransferase